MPRKILIIRFSSIGDIVLTTPVIRCLKQQLGVELHYVTKPAFVNILQANPYVDKIHLLSNDFAKLANVLKQENYDHIIDLHHNLRSGRLRLILHKPYSSFHKLNFEKWLMVNFKIDRLPDVHIVDRYLKTVEKLGVKNDGKGLDFFMPDDKQIDTNEVFGFYPGSYTAIVIGAAHETKCMTADQIAELCQFLNMPVILLGGKQEIEKAYAILNKTQNENVKNACGQFDIFQSASIMQQAKSIISHDTGLMHIAAALQLPQVVVWGNTIPGFGMFPYYGVNEGNTKWTSFEIKGLPCRPCSKIGFEKCPKGHFRCMLRQDLQAIASAVAERVIVRKNIRP